MGFSPAMSDIRGKAGWLDSVRLIPYTSESSKFTL